MDKTQKEKIREFIEDIDNYVDYHGEADKEDIEPYIRKESLINFINEQFDLAIKETEERLVRGVEEMKRDVPKRKEPNMIHSKETKIESIKKRSYNVLWLGEVPPCTNVEL